jgi:hypothetical protein
VQEIGLEWTLYKSPVRLKEVTAPATATMESNTLALYAKDKAGVSALYYKNDAGTEFDLSNSLAIGSTIGSGTVGSVLFVKTGPVLGQDNTTFFWNTADAKLNLGSQGTHTGTNGRLSLDSDTQVTLMEINAHHTAGPAVFFHQSRGTHASPTILSADDRVGFILGKGYGGSSYHDLAYIQFLVDGTPGNNDMPGRIAFATTPDGATSSVVQVLIGQDGGIALKDGITAPATRTGFATIYVDTADGDLKVKFADGFVRVIAADS